jgi:serine protease Do
MTNGFRPSAVAWIGLGLVLGAALAPLTGQPGLPKLPEAPLPGREWQSVSATAKRVLPAVVCIEGQQKAKRDDDPGFGSGVLVSADGAILTSNHVVKDLREVEVTLHDGRKFTSADIRRDPKTDLALVKIEAKEPLPFLEFGDSDAMEVGDRVLAVGAPFGLTGSVSSGIVSAKSRKNLKLNQFEDFLQTDAAMNPGNSGGPLVSMDGRVIGLTAAIKTRSGGFQGVGLAVSSNLAKRVADELSKNGVVKRAVLGITARDLDAATIKKIGGKPTAGAVVTQVTDGSPADQAGVNAGDVITKVNDKPVRDARELQAAISALEVGKVADVLLWRDGKLFVGKLTAEEERVALKPEPKAGNRGSDAVGLAMTDFTEELAVQRKLPKETRGALVSGVPRNGLAERSGVMRGNVVLKVDGTAVTSALGFEKALRAADVDAGAVLHVLRANGDVEFVLLKLK